MRLFISFEIPSELNEYLNKLSDQLLDSNLKLTLSKNYHITLKFLGDVPEQHLESIISILSTISIDVREFNLANVGFFPNETDPRVIYVGVSPDDPLIYISGQINQKFKKLGYKKEDFTAHITLARIKYIDENYIKKYVDDVKKIKVDKFNFKLDSINLIKSTLLKDGPVYEVLFQM